VVGIRAEFIKTLATCFEWYCSTDSCPVRFPVAQTQTHRLKSVLLALLLRFSRGVRRISVALGLIFAVERSACCVMFIEQNSAAHRTELRSLCKNHPAAFRRASLARFPGRVDRSNCLFNQKEIARRTVASSRSRGARAVAAPHRPRAPRFCMRSRPASRPPRWASPDAPSA